jgi:CubicO group peptidase (beta-lactamase class C family)
MNRGCGADAAPRSVEDGDMTIDPEPATPLRDFVERGFAAAGVPGGVVQIVRRTGVVETIPFRGLTADSPVMLGSTSKSLTALGLLCAVEDGAVSLDDSVRHRLPDTDLPPDVTVRDLAHHCSGLATDSTPRRHRHSSSRRFRYANQNYNLLGEVIEEATGTRLDQWLAERVFEPLGLTHTFCAGRGRDDEIAPGHVGVFGRFIHRELAGFGPDEWIQPASGAICSSASDAGRMLRLMLNDGILDGRRLLSRASIRAILHDSVPTHSSPAVDGPLGRSGDYGFGWVGKNLDGEEVFVHVGKVPTHTTVFALVPGRGLGMVLAVNACDFLVATPLLETLADGVIRQLLGHASPPMDARAGATRRAIVNVCHLGILGIGAAGWLIPKSSGAVPTRVGYHFVLPLALAFGIRRLSETPFPWLKRFVPDTCATVLIAATGMIVSGAAWARSRISASAAATRT